jgi:hypothetical protein
MTNPTITEKTAEPNTFDRTVADMKQGVDYATKAQADASEKTLKAAKDFAAFNQASLDAFIQASKIFGAGSQDLFHQATASGQAAFAEILSGFRALVTVKSIKDRIELQASLSRASATWAVSESTRFAQAGIALIEKASAPLTARATAAAETFAALKA